MSSSIDPTQRINQSESSSIPSLFTLSLEALRPHKSQIPLSNLPSHLQKRIIQAFCNNTQELRQLEEFNENYMRQTLGDEVTEEDFDFREAFESRWNQFCRKLNPSPRDYEQAKTEDPYAPYERLYSILKNRERERQMRLNENLIEQRQKEEKVRGRTVQMKTPSNAQQGKKRKRARSPNRGVGSMISRGGSRASSSGGSALLKKAQKSAQRFMIVGNADNPGAVSDASRNIQTGSRIVRRTVAKRNSSPRGNEPVPKNLVRSSRDATNKAPPNPIPSRMRHEIRRTQTQQQGMDPHVPPPIKVPLRKKRKINLLDDRPVSPNSQGISMFGNRPTTSSTSISAIFAPVNASSTMSRLRKSVKRGIDSKRYDDNTKQHIRKEVSKLNKMGKIPKKSAK
uniref:Uncharacterized protein n=1 Tax=Percolomonas cosmopolitus TaxID=63605 RepID=A0A7S1KL10_9EUKA